MNDIEFKSTFDKIEFDIAMKMYDKHNSKIANIYDNIGEIYGYDDLEAAQALEEHDTLQEYKKALKEKCDAFDKVIQYVEEHKNNVYDTFGDPLVFGEIEGVQEILKTIKGE